jgi:hypothetical protein
MNQSFNGKQLMKLCKQAEFVDYGMSINELYVELDLVEEKISKYEFEFEIRKCKDYYLIDGLPQKLILRKLNDNIKRIYKDEQANRRVIISQVKTLLEETCPFWVLKTDIKSFYESIDRGRIIEKIEDDSMLSFQSISLLKRIFDNPTLLSTSGVPRGLNISSTLSEIYMRKFDRWIRRFNGVYYYARFVDDIIIFSNSIKTTFEILSLLNPKLTELAEGLQINEAKTELFSGKTLRSLDKHTGKPLRTSIPLEYLGYSFSKDDTDKPTLKISIAEKKIKKIKNRVMLALLDYKKNKNFALLENRFKFLTGNYSIRKDRDSNDLRAGIYYNYLQVTDLTIFDDLNTFYKKALHCNSRSFGRKLSFTQSQKKSLNKYCFKAGFKMKVFNSFRFDEMSDIIKCW